MVTTFQAGDVARNLHLHWCFILSLSHDFYDEKHKQVFESIVCFNQKLHVDTV